jgi:carbamoyltransferase
MSTLGISAYYHDSAVSLVGRDGNILAAVQEERFTRRKHDSIFPAQSISYCASVAQNAGDPITRVVFYEIPTKKFDRIVRSAATVGESGKEEFIDAMARWLGGMLYQVEDIEAELDKAGILQGIEGNLFFVEHHLSHAASAYYPSPFQEAAILTLDGVGESTTTALWHASDRNISPVQEMHYPNSLGLLYSAFTHFTGFKVNSGEYKMMGLAPYGTPRYVEQIKDKIIVIGSDGSFRINQDYFDYFAKDSIINEKFSEVFDLPIRQPSDALEVAYADVSASIQKVIEEIVLNLVNAATDRLGVRNVCMAGGVALNSVANGRVQREANIDSLWIQPAAGDAGGSLGAALYGHYVLGDAPRAASSGRDSMSGSLLGTTYSNSEIKARLDELGAVYEEVLVDSVNEKVAQLIQDGNVIGWFQGRMEFGPRALGARSIIADPRIAEMQRKLNLKIKKRESFRPFAPAVLKEHAAEWFQMTGESPYMLLVHPVHPDKRQSKDHTDAISPEGQVIAGRTGKSDISAITHVDFSARVQTVDQTDNPNFYNLLNAFYQKTGCPVLINTSFNVRGEPIVEKPEDAFGCLVNTEMDYLAIGNLLVKREDQDPLVVMRMFQEFEDD